MRAVTRLFKDVTAQSQRASALTAVGFRPAAGGLTGERAVAQFGSALDWGSSGRRFKSCQPDTDQRVFLPS
jgi:hypothetical protein